MIKTKEVNEIRTEADVIICDSCGKEIRKNKARQRASDGREERMTGFHGHDWNQVFSLLNIN